MNTKMQIFKFHLYISKLHLNFLINCFEQQCPVYWASEWVSGRIYVVVSNL